MSRVCLAGKNYFKKPNIEETFLSWFFRDINIGNYVSKVGQESDVLTNYVNRQTENVVEDGGA